jgi:hypothetical protein
MILKLIKGKTLVIIFVVVLTLTSAFSEVVEIQNVATLSGFLKTVCTFLIFE